MPTKAEFAKINIACKELGIDKYQLLADRYRLNSSKDLSRTQVWDLLGHLRRLGWRAKRSKKAPTSPVYLEEQKRKIVALWIALHKAGVVRDRSDRALQHYVKRMTGVDNLKWCEGAQINAVCQSLIEWGRRVDIDVDG